ncbi:MAG: radical SAM protein [Candidatus Gastranaerophilales bacterium]|nr:radical SAM protein [Candidatus Gastranaerophilales bacterium]
MTKMFRCKFLAHGLYIHYDCFRHCHLSIHSPNERNNNYIIPYTGPQDKIDWEKVFEIKNSRVKSMREGDIPPFCKGCHWIEEFDETSDEQYLSDFENYIDMIWLGHSNQCNANCIYCFAYQEILEHRTIKGYDIFPLFKELLDKKIYNLEKNPNAHVSFAMGEPTIMQNFDDIIKTFADGGNKFFALYSNGIHFSKMTEKVLAMPDVEINVVISLDAGSREVFKKVKKVDKFDTVCENIKKYAAAANKPKGLGVKYIIIPDINDTKEEIDRWLDICINKLNVKYLIADIEEHWFVQKHGEVPEYIKDLLRYIRQRCLDANIDFEFYDRALVLHL